MLNNHLTPRSDSWHVTSLPQDIKFNAQQIGGEKMQFTSQRMLYIDIHYSNIKK